MTKDERIEYAARTLSGAFRHIADEFSAGNRPLLESHHYAARVIMEDMAKSREDIEKWSGKEGGEWFVEAAKISIAAREIAIDWLNKQMAAADER